MPQARPGEHVMTATNLTMFPIRVLSAGGSIFCLLIPTGIMTMAMATGSRFPRWSTSPHFFEAGGDAELDGCAASHLINPSGIETVEE